jgi:hypothetical protein
MRERTVDLERWRQFSLLDQMANIASEVGRTMNARRAGDEQRFWAALQRALDLFEATTLTEMHRHPHRLKEVGRAKEEFVRIAAADEFDDGEARRLEAYFMHFALASRVRHLEA